MRGSRKRPPRSEVRKLEVGILGFTLGSDLGMRLEGLREDSKWLSELRVGTRHLARTRGESIQGWDFGFQGWTLVKEIRSFGLGDEI